ncbi:hypothetical protein [Lysinibacillus sphaericus]|uniref:hypothetical protein n=1 Tax=Lysinibacillus sphaericus TaxID=1421 RepID=UPI003CFF25E7
MTKFIEQRVGELENEVAELKLIVHELRGHRDIDLSSLTEPSATNSVEDIIEFEGKQYSKVDRKARKGDVVIFRNQTNNHIPINNTPYLMDIDDEYIEIDVDEYCVYSEIHNRNLETVAVYELIETKPLTPNQQRAAVIEKAKAFVKNIVGEYDTFNTTVGRYKDQCVSPIFHVNEKKRAITVLIYGAFSKDLIFKGLAKCIPSDVYNEHIGKAIALGRALGLDVSEFEQAVQPNKVVEGHVTKGKYTGRIYNITEVRSHREIIAKEHHVGQHTGMNDVTIINDTNAKYGVNSNE